MILIKGETRENLYGFIKNDRTSHSEFTINARTANFSENSDSEIGYTIAEIKTAAFKMIKSPVKKINRR
jgi:hypothetical protein